MRTRMTLLLLALIPSTLGAEWRKYTSKDGRFTVSMPGNPTHEVQRSNTDAGVVVGHLFRSSAGDISYAVSYADLSDDLVKTKGRERVLDEARDGMIAGLQAQLVSEVLIEHTGLPGREIKLIVPTGRVLQSRLFLKGSRHYTLMAASSPKGAFSLSIRDYFASFEAG